MATVASLMIHAHHGVWASAAPHLRWEDIDEAAGEVIWRAEHDKGCREWTQPVTHEMVSALSWATPLAQTLRLRQTPGVSEP
jgi:hypothetical protein